MKHEAALKLVSSQLLILQSKRLMLQSTERRLEETGLESLHQRVQKLRADAESAQHRYRQAVLRHAPPESADYWLVAYGRLIETAGVLSRRLVAAADKLPARERYEATADVEELEHIMDGWQQAWRKAMAESVA